MTTTDTGSSRPATANLVEKHRESLQSGREALTSRGYFSRYPESPSPRVYGEGAATEGLAAFEAHLGAEYAALGDQPTDGTFAGSEVSPYGPLLRVRYPRLDVDSAILAARAAIPAWRDAGALTRAAVCVEVVDAINKRSFEVANAVMHTS
ncbi:MAG: phenylacetic acid degradation protein PaaN, partial [Actinomycetota bacterium]